MNNQLITLRKLFNSSVEWGVLEKNPMQWVKSVTIDRNEDDFDNWYNNDEIIHLLEVIKEQYPKYYPIFLTIAHTGMRIGEVTGLKRGDLDFDNKVIKVRRSVWRRIEKTTKSIRSRKLKMTEELSQVLQEHCNGKKSSELIFTNTEGGYVYSKTLEKPLFKAQQIAGLKRVTLHGLRHTVGTALVKKRDVKAVQRFLGHQSLQMTLRYLHIAGCGEEETGKALEEIFSGNKAADTTKTPNYGPQNDQKDQFVVHEDDERTENTPSALSLSD